MSIPKRNITKQNDFSFKEQKDMENPILKQNNPPLLLYFMNFLTKHPFIVSAVICLLCTPVEMGSDHSAFAVLIPAAALTFLGIIGSVFISERVHGQSRITLRYILCGSSAVFGMIFGYLVSQSGKPALVILMTAIVSSVTALIYMLFSRTLNEKRFILLMLALGFVIRFAYIMINDIVHHQHDAGSVGELDGHIGYIAYISYNLHLPDFDVRNVYQFYHPPLHHIIAAAWARLQNLFGVPFDMVWENVQILTLFYSCCTMILSYKLFRRLGLSGTGLCTAMAIVCFNPTLFILSGSINNDMLSITLMLAALYNTLCWYKSRSFGRIMCIAVSIGCAMMAKLSGWMAAPAIAFIFIYVFFTDIRNYKKYIPQFAAFLPVSAVLGLWWGIRNLVMYDVPITYVMRLSEKSSQYIGDIPVLERIFDFNPSQLESVGDQFKMYGGKYNEYNPLIALFKTSAFDELYTVKYYSDTAGWDRFLFFSVVSVGIIGFFAMIYVMIADKDFPTPYKLFTGILYAVFFISYYAFCIGFPQVCTENIRYAVPLIIEGALFFGRAVQLLFECKRQWLAAAARTAGYMLCTVAVLYSFSSVIFYYIVFMN